MSSSISAISSFSRSSWWRRALFAVAQGGVEYNDAVLVGLVDGGHRRIPLAGALALEALKGLVISRNP